MLIHEEFRQASSSSNYSNESEEDERIRVENMVFGQLISACYNMVGFQCDKQIIREVICSFAVQNSISQNFLDILENTISNPI